ncbi:MAG: ATP-binding protein [Hymenobacter sp.]
MPTQTLLSWSGGKDSALALHHARRDPRYHVAHLLTSVNAHYERVSMHGVRVALLEAQAARIGLPLTQVRLPETPSMAEYDVAQQTAFAGLRARGVEAAFYGDIFLEDLRAYREEQLARAGLRGEFPPWRRPGTELLREFLDLGFRAIIVCVNERWLDASFCGRLLDADFLRDLPPGVDPCGENGEYHSFVFDAPYFSAPILFEKDELVRRPYLVPPGSPLAGAAFWYQDLLPAG